MSSTELIKQAIATKGRANLLFSGKSMYPTLKDSMMLSIVKASFPSIKVSDIIAYQDDNIIVAHRVIGKVYNNKELAFITKGDNQPFGGIGRVEQKDLIGKVVGAFYKDGLKENILNKNLLYSLSFVFLGRAYLFYRKFIRKNIPEFLRMFLKEFVRGLHFIFRKFTSLTENLC